ncbi:transposase [Emticicia sp. TH156]|uniref:transposase n=1 Tax=Emticicia sp. TH156 TaxID=2067454 RepID=UPI001C1FCEEA|nr:transposase [Emticicia sp. TH156]
MTKHRKKWTPEEKLEILDYKKTHGLTKTSREFEVSTVSILNWEKVYSEQGPEGLKKGARTSLERELQQLHRGNRELKAKVAEKDLALRVKDSLLKKAGNENRGNDGGRGFSGSRFSIKLSVKARGVGL